MVLKGIHLFFIMVFFVIAMGGAMVFMYRYKFIVASRLSKELGFTSYLSEKNIPGEYTAFGEHILEFNFFEWILVGEVQGEKVYIAQYFLNRASQYPFRFVVFIPFEKKMLSISEIPTEKDDFLITQNGIFYYHALPWTLKKENILPLVNKIVQVRKSFE